MVMKNDGRISNKEKKNKQHKKYRPVRCADKECKGVIDVDLAIEIGDIDYCDNDKNSIYVYCPICALQHKVELKK